jgi:hydrogenase maturation protease
MNDHGNVLVLGIGNILWADEGFGVRCVERLAEAWTLPPEVMLMDGGTQGLYLLPYVQAARRMIIFDAVDYGLPPGTVKRVEDDQVPRFMGAKKMSLHQTGFQEVLAAAALTGHYPEQMLLIGVQPEELDDYGGSLTPLVRERLGECVDIALARLHEWGYPARRREQHAPLDQASGSALAMDCYEAGRPSAEAACRVGDARFLAT